MCVLERRPLLGGAAVTEELWPGRRPRSAGATSTQAAPCTPPPSSPTWRRRAAAGSRVGSAGRPVALRRLAIDHRAPLREEAGQVVVRCALRRAGRVSLITDETITTAAGEVVAHAEATLVLEDEGGRPRMLEAGEREALAR